MDSQAQDTFYTIESATEGVYSQMRSKFISFVVPIESEEEALGVVTNIRTKYYDARHICWAYRIGYHGERYRINDDGEPSGTAGKPIHGQLVSANLTNIIALVVRYFGGVKLGTSGLIEAYREATIAALEGAIRKTCVIERSIRITFTYELMGEVMRAIKDHEAKILSQDFQEQCLVQVSLRANEAPNLWSKLNSLYGVSPEWIEE